jgi:hypothetical protein
MAAFVAAILVQCIAYAGCDDSPSEPPPGTIFPLEPGTKWTYAFGVTDSVTGVQIVDGKEYAMIYGGPLGVPSGLVRMDGSRLIYRDGVGEQILLDFGADILATWAFVNRNSNIIYHVTLKSKRIQVSTPAGEFAHCFRFDFIARNAVDANRILVVYPGVGVVLYTNWLLGQIPLLSFESP